MVIMGDIRKNGYPGYDFTQELLAVEQLAVLVHKSVASIRSDASRNPSALPPICRLPGNKRLLFRVEDVRAWLGKHVQEEVSKVQEPQTVLMPRRPGRPRKVASISVISNEGIKEVMQ